jgi:two-component sensor histidine kinase
MLEEKLPTFESFGTADGMPSASEKGHVGTETIDLSKLFAENLTQSGSFNVGGARASSFRNLLHALPIPALLVDQTFSIVFANHFCGKISSEYLTVIGSPFSGLFANPRVAEKAQNIVESLFETRKALVAEAILEIGKRKVWSRIHLRTIRLGLQRAILVIVEDITAEKKELVLKNKQEKVLSNSRDELEKRVAKRTLELKTINERLQNEIGERETTNKLLQLEVAQRMKVEDQLRASLKEKEVLLGEIHHRVKNNLQVIISLLALQSRAVKDEKVAGALQDSQNRVRSMALIHEQLYRSGELSRIDYRAYLRTLTEELLRSYSPDTDSISLEMDVDEIYLGIKTALPCSLIISELVSNCLKHAFGRDGPKLIKVSLRRLTDGKYRLVVEDNGQGFPPDFDYRNSESLGLRLVTNLTELQLHGRMELRKDRGTEFTIEFEALEDGSGN